ncbi:hypothetical protein [Mesobacillus zeae]|uniref:Uncharacterized protein n=1 Tax=Mesobacillus zeae TaxID=1917180 RepID=A0A398AYC3_9BACI|nr:hypothetical protein [Mesobacillus zeae]RID82669.1 hypothetical protein D1970_18220 [Mesobacillus zeae]
MKRKTVAAGFPFSFMVRFPVENLKEVYKNNRILENVGEVGGEMVAKLSLMPPKTSNQTTLNKKLDLINK